MDIKNKIQNHKLIMFVMLWLLLAVIIIGLLLNGQALLGLGFSFIVWQLSKTIIKLIES